MNKLFRSFSAVAAGATALVFATAAHAQIETFNTIVANTGGTNVNFVNGNVALSQTFTNVAELNNLTYEFVENGVDTTDQTISAYLVQWDTANNSVSATTTLETLPNDPASDVTTALSTTPLSTFIVPPASGDANGTWSTLTYSGTSNTYPAFQETLNINQYLDPSLTYAIVLIDTSGANSTLGLPGVDVSDTNNSFDNSGNPYGLAYENNPSTHPYPTISSMVNSSGGQKNALVTGLDDETYGFSQIQLVPGGNIIPTPEPRTAAAILCALFVAVLVGRQLILRRQEFAGGGLALAA